MPPLTKKPAPVVTAPAADALPALTDHPPYRAAAAEYDRLCRVDAELRAALRRVETDIRAAADRAAALAAGDPAEREKAAREVLDEDEAERRQARKLWDLKLSLLSRIEAVELVIDLHRKGTLGDARRDAVKAVAPAAFERHWRPAVRKAAAARLLYLRHMHDAGAVAEKLADGTGGTVGGPDPLPWFDKPGFGWRDYKGLFEGFAREVVAGGFFDAHEPAVLWDECGD
jgi:hypothetical protein